MGGDKAVVAKDAPEGGVKRKADEITKPAANGKGKDAPKKKEESEEENDEENDDDENDGGEGDDDEEGDDDGEGDDDDEDEDDDDDDEDGGSKKEKSKKRRTAGSDDDEDDDGSDADEVTLNKDDFIEIDPKNIIPRARRRAAVAAMSKPMEIPTKSAEGGDDEEESDEAEF